MIACRLLFSQDQVEIIPAARRDASNSLTVLATSSVVAVLGLATSETAVPDVTGPVGRSDLSVSRSSITLQTLKTLDALRTGIAGWAGWAGRPSWTSRSSITLQTLKTLDALRTGIAGWAVGPVGPRRTGWAGLPQLGRYHR